jgi:sulfatase maturation enzyme AslB (radical SAM superfamily)
MKAASKKIQKEPKQVTFAEKLITNEESLDKSMIERIKHNLEYNDDR